MPPRSPLGIKEAWDNPEHNSSKPPPPNNISSVPYNRFVYLLDDLSNLFQAIVIDPDVAANIQRITPPFDEKDMTRKKVKLNLMGGKEVFSVEIWVVPVFQDGVLVAQVFAADSTNQQLLAHHRPTSEMDHYDFTNSL